MRSAVDIGVVKLIVRIDRLDKFQWLLRGGGIIEIDQWRAIHLAVQQWNVFADFAQIEWDGVGWCIFHGDP
jgi:hypothetical protein